MITQLTAWKNCIEKLLNDTDIRKTFLEQDEDGRKSWLINEGVTSATAIQIKELVTQAGAASGAFEFFDRSRQEWIAAMTSNATASGCNPKYCQFKDQFPPSLIRTTTSWSAGNDINRLVASAATLSNSGQKGIAAVLEDIAATDLTLDNDTRNLVREVAALMK